MYIQQPSPKDLGESITETSVCVYVNKGQCCHWLQQWHEQFQESTTNKDTHYQDAGHS